ncbi:hypothetical protein [Flagellimonas marinaquae]
MTQLKYAKGFLRKDHGQQADRQTKLKWILKLYTSGMNKRGITSAVGHLTLHGGKADRFLKALPSKALGVGAHETAGAPRAITDHKKARATAVLPLR